MSDSVTKYFEMMTLYDNELLRARQDLIQFPPKEVK